MPRRVFCRGVPNCWCPVTPSPGCLATASQLPRDDNEEAVVECAQRFVDVDREHGESSQQGTHSARECLFLLSRNRGAGGLSCTAIRPTLKRMCARVRMRRPERGR